LKEVGLQTQIAFCPERIVEGQALKEIASLPQIIGAYDSETHERARKLFETLGVKCIPLTPEEAELAKLFTNYWRYVKFAAANQLWSISQELDLDYSRIRNALSLDYPRAKDLPMSGFTAGPCLLKDSAQLVAFSGLGAPLISSSIEINENLPKFMVHAVEKKFELGNCVVGILGMAFKGESDDIRGSLAFKLRKLLLFRSKQVLCSDPFVVDERLVTQEEVLSQCDLIFIGAPHKQYLNIDFKVPVIDIWDLLGQGVRI
jgi:UDP-N-acetyl-D-mannosaminuronic acid dehydrogenase